METSRTTHVFSEASPSRRSTQPASLLAGSPAGLGSLATLMRDCADVAANARSHASPLPSGSSRDVWAAASARLGPSELPREGIGPDRALALVTQVMFEHGLDLSHPHAVAHLQPPTLSVAVVADALASVSNASLDTYDSGPSAIAIERWVIGVLTKLARLGPRADGVLTPGGSMSNLLGLLLARDAAAARRGVDARRDGVAGLRSPIIFCSELAHFSMHRACAALGLGESAVRALPTDPRRRMQASALAKLLRSLKPHEVPCAIVATAGTTDFGSIDPLPELAELAAEYAIWLHVDAAYGFGALFSERMAERLAGIERADSITLDLHKLGWQPAAASALLVADSARFRALAREVAYLNPQDDSEAGLDGLLGRSLQTTRRPDALKMATTLFAFGRRGLGELVDACHELARHAERSISATPELELVAPAELTTVVFRYRAPGAADSWQDELNGALRRRLLERGSALIGRTAVKLDGPESTPRVCLKLTLLNPTTTPRDIDELLETVARAGRECARELEGRDA